MGRISRKLTYRTRISSRPKLWRFRKRRTKLIATKQADDSDDLRGARAFRLRSEGDRTGAAMALKRRAMPHSWRSVIGVGEGNAKMVGSRKRPAGERSARGRLSSFSPNKAARPPCACYRVLLSRIAVSCVRARQALRLERRRDAHCSQGRESARRVQSRRAALAPNWRSDKAPQGWHHEFRHPETTTIEAKP
jgi:hypothetical protein